MFTPVRSNVTDVLFFVPGAADAASAVAAEVTGFGAVFVDVDLPDGSGAGRQANRRASTLLEFFDAANRRLFSGFAPSAPGDGNFSFLGIVFPDPLIARVRITTGSVAPGPDETSQRDIVVMDDFIYGEPQAISPATGSGTASTR